MNYRNPSTPNYDELTPSSLHCLVADEDKELCALFSDFLYSSFNLNCDTAQTSAEALQLLRQYPDKYSLIISEQRLSPAGGEALWSFLQKESLSIPFILCISTRASLPALFKNAPLAGTIEKPFFQNSLHQLVSTILSQKLPEESRKLFTPSARSPDYERVRSRLLSKIKKAPCSIYLKINAEKFLKIFRTDDVLTEQEVHRVQKKNLNFFYIKKDDLNIFYESIMKELEAQSSLSAPGANGSLAQDEDTDLSLYLAHDLQESLNHLCVQMGFSLELEQLAKKCLKTVLRLIAKNPKLEVITKNLMKGDNYISSHSIFLCFITCWLARQMDWHSEKTLEKLTFASLLHDITLNNDLLAMVKTEKELIEKQVLFTPKEIEAWRAHALNASQISTLFADIPPGVDVIIHQHHDEVDLSDNEFFHKNNPTNSITPLSALFIVAHDLVDYIIQEKQGAFFLEDFVTSHKTKFNYRLFKLIFRAIENSLPKVHP